ncbi:MAG TPA: TonB-dependent receptor [Steroidobacteraceae bacterium]|nr:TonB-dependent receptor [Steroidobacteraceae bacterium]
MTRNFKRVAAVSVGLASFAASRIWASDAAPAATNSSDALQEITVTAEKQTENLQKAPAAVTALPTDILIDAGVTDLRQAQQVVPSVRFQAEGNNTQVFIRGVGANLDFPNVEPNVAFNFAGIYLPREATSAAFFDVAQLEILPGSQGTLYGRSAIGGTINLTPAKPSFNNDGETLIEAGNYSYVHATVTQNVKVSDSIALRAALDYAYDTGYEVTGADSKNDPSARLSALIKPSDALSIYLWAQAAEKRGFTENLVNKGTNPATGAYCEMCYFFTNPWNDTRTGRYAAPFGQTDAARNHYKTDMIGGEIDYQFEHMTLSYLPSYLYLDARPIYWLSAIESTNTAHYNQISQELRLSSNGPGSFKWLVGLNYYDSRNSGSEYLFVNEPFSFYQTNVNSDMLQGSSLFGQLTYSVTDAFRLTGGGRVSSTKREASGFEVVALGGAPYEFDKTYNHVDWKAGFEYDVAPQVMVYGVIQTGFQPGTFNALPNTSTFSNEVHPEELKSYTAGFKSRWLDDRLQINNEAYYYAFHNLIIQAYDISAPYNLIFNGDKVGIRGDQLDILARVLNEDTANFNVGYSRARNVDVVDTNGKSYDGLQPAYAPDWVIEAGYTHNQPLANATLRWHLDARYESSWFADYVHNKGTEQTGSAKADASVTYDATAWTAGLWVKNMTNRAVIAATAAAGIPGPATAYLEDPRTMGVRFTIKY